MPKPEKRPGVAEEQEPDPREHLLKSDLSFEELTRKVLRKKPPKGGWSREENSGEGAEGSLEPRQHPRYHEEEQPGSEHPRHPLPERNRIPPQGQAGAVPVTDGGRRAGYVASFSSRFA